MCGIAGILRLDNRPAEIGDVEAMADRLQHRGPDAFGSWQEGCIALSHRRLSIRDVTPAGAQPFFSPCKRIVVVYNGEIYNDREIAERLHRESGFVARTTSDTEIIPAAYLAWGEGAVRAFEGIFSFALWDRKLQRLLLARDSAGTKPLYVAESETSLHFASELKAILAVRKTKPHFSPPDVAHMLALGFPAPNRTTLENIRQISPGSLLIADENGIREKRYWKAQRIPDISDLKNATTDFIDTFRTVVSDQLVSDVSVGSLQSGGIDSSLITMALPKDCDIPLFSVRFPEASHDESDLVRSLAAVSGRRVVWVDLASGDDVVTDFEACVTAADGQLADSSMLAAYRLCAEIRRHVVVALSGDGADEFFGGYPTYRATMLAERISRLTPGALALHVASGIKAMAGVSEARMSKGEIAYRFAYGLGQAAPHAAWRHYLPSGERRELYGPALAGELSRDPLALYQQAYTDAVGLPSERGMVADQSFYLPADMLVKVDRVSMAHGLELRVPFLDRRIMELANRMTSALFFGDDGRSTKLVLRNALQQLCTPRNVYDGPKRGFNVPINTLLRGALGQLADRLLDRDADVFAPLLSPDGVRRLWRRHRGGSRDEKYVIWTLLTLGLWIEKEHLH